MAIKRTYKKWLGELKQTIVDSRVQAALKVNSDMLMLYWYIGVQIIDKTEKQGWGAKVIEQLSDDLSIAFPDMKGFSVRNLKYMRQFAEAYPALLVAGTPIGQQAAAQLESKQKISAKTKAAKSSRSSKNVIGQQAAAQLEKAQDAVMAQHHVAQMGEQLYTLENPILVSIPWGHHMFLLDKVDAEKERMWYIQNTADNHWSRAVLQYHVETDLYTRQNRKKSSNFEITLPKPQADLANALLKDPYVFRFSQIGEFTTERELEQLLIKHIQEFIMELGAGFAFVGRQTKLKAGRKEYFLDLLFYHLYLHCYIVIELKMEAFELAHAGVMNGYLNLVNKVLRQPQDNPSIGIILCASKDSVEVDFALTNINQPIGVSEYTFSKTLPAKLKDRFPTAKQLQNEVKLFMKKQRIKK